MVIGMLLVTDAGAAEDAESWRDLTETMVAGFLSELREEEEETGRRRRKGLSRLPSAHNKYPDGMLSAPA